MGISDTDDSRQMVRTTEFKNPGFNAADQVEVFKKLIDLNRKGMEEPEPVQSAGRRIEFPHSWFAGDCSYALPVEVPPALSGILKQGWTSRLEEK